MKKNRRGNNRRPEALEMFVKSTTGENRTYTTLNVSDNGIFVLATFPDQLPVGTEVTVMPAQFMGNSQQLSIKGRVARAEDNGMGIEFVDSKFN